MLKKILVVDDSSLIHQMYKLVLARYCCTIEGAMNGVEALEMISQHGYFDLILLDINMPVMNGLQFLENVATSGLPKKTPIIIISTEGKEEDTIRGLKLGAKGYLKKPFNPPDLHALIAAIFKDPQGASKAVAAG